MRVLVLVFVLMVWASCALAMDFPSPVVPAGLGVNIHFTGDPAQDLFMLQAAGFRFIRQDFQWQLVEQAKGHYNFDAYDQQTAGLARHGIRPLYILDYGNTLYEPERRVTTEAGRRAFAAFATAAVTRYKGRGVIWELWNEPNGFGWLPQPNVDEYMALAKVVLPAIRAADPQATIIAPATESFGFPFLEACCRQGLLDMVDGVSVHPYRQSNPETVVEDYARLRALIARFTPARRTIPIISGEWGYSTSWKQYSAERQGQYLPREFLINLSQGIPLSIWYDWHNDSLNPADPESNFGTVTFEYKPKPAYQAMERLTTALHGMRFRTRLPSAPGDYLLLFSDGTRATLVVWTTDEAPPPEPGENAAPGGIETTGGTHALELWPGMNAVLTGDPQYLPVPETAEALQAAAAWTLETPRATLSAGAAGDGAAFTVRVRNPFAREVAVQVSTPELRNLTGAFTGPAHFRLKAGAEGRLTWQGTPPTRRDLPTAATVEVALDAAHSRRTLTFDVANPIGLGVMALHNGAAALVVRLPKDAVHGTLRVTAGAEVRTLDLLAAAHGKVTVRLDGATLTPLPADDSLLLPLPGTIDLRQPVHLQVREGNTTTVDATCRVALLSTTTAALVAINDGDPQVPATFALTDVPAGAAANGVRLTYEYGTGWKFVRLAPRTPLLLDGAPHALGVWVRGNTSRCWMVMRIVDANGRIFQAIFGRLDFTGWRFLTAPLDDPRVYHFGGDGDDSRIAYPIRLDTAFSVDGAKQPVKDELELSGFQVLYNAVENGEEGGIRTPGAGL